MKSQVEITAYELINSSSITNIIEDFIRNEGVKLALNVLIDIAKAEAYEEGYEHAKDAGASA